VIGKSSLPQLEAIGLSPQKASLIKKVTYDILDKKLSFQKMAKASSSEIHQTLIKYKYLGD
jgi:3-methyladenine DNA glycosylase/8-oxoguanine DNA glycosylase